MKIAAKLVMTQVVDVDAKSYEQAVERAKEMYDGGEIVFGIGRSTNSFEIAPVAASGHVALDEESLRDIGYRCGMEDSDERPFDNLLPPASRAECFLDGVWFAATALGMTNEEWKRAVQVIEAYRHEVE